MENVFLKFSKPVWETISRYSPASRFFISNAPFLSDKIKLVSEESFARITETVASAIDCRAEVSRSFPFTEPLTCAPAIIVVDRMRINRIGFRINSKSVYEIRRKYAEILVGFPILDKRPGQ